MDKTSLNVSTSRELENFLSQLGSHNGELSNVRYRLEGVIGRLDGTGVCDGTIEESQSSGTLSQFSEHLSDYKSTISQIQELLTRLEAVA